MSKIYLLLLMAQLVVSSRNLNQILDRDEWISIAKEYISNHKPYKVKNYEPYKPQVVNLPNSFGGEFWETTISPEVTTTEGFSTTEPTSVLESTTASGNTDFIETTTSAYESSATETSEITTEPPSTLIPTTKASSITETESTTLESLVDQIIPEISETTTEILISTTVTPEISTSTDGESTFNGEVTSTEATPSTTWPWFSSTQPSEITTESIISAEAQEKSTLIETSTTESTTSESPETSTSLLDIISTTPGFETTTTYLDTAIESTEATDFSTETTQPGFNIANQTQEVTTEASKPTTTTKRASIVEDAIRPKKRKMKYTSDTEPEISWD
ncbi:hypothetical protein KR054_007315 [Drosophila jambulina]|nr:hypothetical protein KR054_007315 [Drosophila jambulina]